MIAEIEGVGEVLEGNGVGDGVNGGVVASSLPNVMCGRDGYTRAPTIGGGGVGGSGVGGGGGGGSGGGGSEEPRGYTRLTRVGSMRPRKLPSPR